MNKEIMIVGVDPPCPRCDLTRQRVERIVKEMGSDATVRNPVYSSDEARILGESIGKKVGTAKHVADLAGIDMDWQKVRSVFLKPPTRPVDYDAIDGPAKRWSPEMDEALGSCQQQAESVDMLMTPILVINGHVRHHCSVPSIEQLRSWLA